MMAVISTDQLPSGVLLPPSVLPPLPPLLPLLPLLPPLLVLDDFVVNVIVAPLSDWVPAVGDMPAGRKP